MLAFSTYIKSNAGNIFDKFPNQKSFLTKTVSFDILLREINLELTEKKSL